MRGGLKLVVDLTDLWRGQKEIVTAVGQFGGDPYAQEILLEREASKVGSRASHSPRWHGYFPSKDAVIQAIADEHVANLSALREARSPKALVAALSERLSNGDPAANRLELEAWAYAFDRQDLRNRLLENTGELRSAVKMALARIGEEQNAQPTKRAGLLVETFALGLVAQAALGREENESREGSRHSQMREPAENFSPIANKQRLWTKAHPRGE